MGGESNIQLKRFLFPFFRPSFLVSFISEEVSNININMKELSFKDTPKDTHDLYQ